MSLDILILRKALKMVFIAINPANTDVSSTPITQDQMGKNLQLAQTLWYPKVPELGLRFLGAKRSLTAQSQLISGLPISWALFDSGDSSNHSKFTGLKVWMSREESKFFSGTNKSLIVGIGLEMDHGRDMIMLGREPQNREANTKRRFRLEAELNLRDDVDCYYRYIPANEGEKIIGIETRYTEKGQLVGFSVSYPDR